jgi:hypothetical protein
VPNRARQLPAAFEMKHKITCNSIGHLSYMPAEKHRTA